MESRLTIAYIFIGGLAGAYEAAYNYAMQRVQFGKPIAGFQMTQQKLVKMLADIQACLTLLMTTTTNYMKGKATMGQISMVKAHCARIGRENVRVAREI